MSQPEAELTPEPVVEPSTATDATTLPAEATTAATVSAATPPDLMRAIPLLWVVRLALIIAALMLGLFAQNLLDTARQDHPGYDSVPTLPWYLFALGAVLLAAGAWRAPLLSTAVPAPLRQLWSNNPRRRLALILFAAAILCAIISIPLFLQINADQMELDGPLTNSTVSPLVANGAWMLFLASLAFFGAALIAWESGAKGGSRVYSADPFPDQLPHWVEFGLVATLFVVALIIRTVNLQQAPPGMWFDEAQEGVIARQITGWNSPHPVYIGGYIQTGGLYFYLVGIALSLTGPQLLTMRLFPAVAGAICVALLYILASRLFGWRAGLAASALLTVSVWNITISRLGMFTMATVALDLAVLTCLVLGLRSGRVGWYGLAGVLLGFALQIYFSARLLPIVIVLLFLHKLISERTRFLRGIRLGVPTFLIGMVLSFLPLGLFALQRPSAFMTRLSAVSVIQGNGIDTAALGDSIKKHLLMFNWMGDSNFRHNLSGEPMLDTVVGALFVVGLGYCLIRAMHWQYFLPIAWLFASLLGGILSVSFEAPQAHRTVENSITTSLIAGVALGALATALTRRPRLSTLPVPEPMDETRALPILPASPAPVRPDPLPASPRLGVWRWAALVIAVALIFATTVQVGNANIARYVKQSNLYNTWQEMDALEYNAARIIHDYSASYDVYVSAPFLGVPQQIFLAPNAKALEYPGEWAIPTADPLDHNIALVLDPADGSDFARLTQLYPGATFSLLQAPNYPVPLQYVALIPAKEQQALHGVHLSIYPANAVAQSKPLSERDVDSINQTWSKDAPAPPFNVRYTATLRIAPAGDPLTTTLNQLYLKDDPTAQITIDGYAHTTAQPLAAGLHSLVVSTTINSPNQSTVLLMRGPDGAAASVDATMLFKASLIPHGLTGYYRQGTDYNTTPDLIRLDPIISFALHHPPFLRPYSVEWKGKLYVPTTGSYKLGTEQISTSNLQIDGNVVLINNELNGYHDVTVNLSAGFHDIRLLFNDRDGSSHIYLYWTPPNQQDRSVIPSAFLWPVQATYPDPKAGGNWPTLDQADGSVIAPKYLQPLPSP